MARLTTSISGRFAASRLGITQGPTGQVWSQDALLTPASLNKRTDDADYVDEATSFIGIFSIWFYDSINNRSDSNMLLHFVDTVGVRTFVEIGLSGGFPFVLLTQPLNTPVVQVTGTTQVTPNAWNNLLVSWNINTGSAYSSEFHLYLNDVDVKPVAPTTFLTGTPVEWGAGNLFVTVYRMNLGNTGATTNVRYSAIWCTWFEYLDMSIASNRRRFTGAGPTQIPLGVDGSLPTGTQPPLYIDNPAAAILSSRGTIGDFNQGAGGNIVDPGLPIPP